MARSADRQPPASVGLVVLVASIVIAGLVGLGMRLWFLGNAPINSDEATVGLMAHEILHGHTSAFYWGQSYGGVEPYVVASVMAVFGQSPLALTATPALLSLVGALLVWRIGLRLFPPMAAVSAAALTWIWSESALWNSTRELGLHQVCLVLGLVVMLWALRIVQHRPSTDVDPVLDWAVFGGAIGVGFWASPEIVYFALPSVIVAALALRGRALTGSVARVSICLGAAVIGALPWLVATVRGGGSSLPASPLPYWSRLGTFFSHVLPMTLGLRIEGAGAWEGRTAVALALYALLLVAVVGSIAVVAVRTRDGLVLVLAVALLPFLYAAFPTSWFWNDGRYAIAVSPLVALLVMGALWEVVRVSVARWAASVAVAAALASTLVAFNAGYGTIAHPTMLTRWSTDPNPAITALARRLEAIGVGHAYAGYWVANDLTFLSGSRVIAKSLDVDRNPPAASSVETSPAGWIFVVGANLGPAASQLGSVTDLNAVPTGEVGLTNWLGERRIPYRRISAGVFDVIVPSQRLSPVELGPVAG
jgi:hypothetical protein